jgi:hypothetical protein
VTLNIIETFYIFNHTFSNAGPHKAPYVPVHINAGTIGGVIHVKTIRNFSLGTGISLVAHSVALTILSRISFTFFTFHSIPPKENPGVTPRELGNQGMFCACICGGGGAGGGEVNWAELALGSVLYSCDDGDDGISLPEYLNNSRLFMVDCVIEN